MARVPLLGGAYQAKSIIANAQRCVNLYPEANPSSSQPQSPSTHYPTPGLVKIGEIVPPDQPNIWVVSQSCALLKFLLSDTGNVAPTVNIVGSNTGLTGPLGDNFSITLAMDFDSKGLKFALENVELVDGSGLTSVLVYRASDNGNVSPVYKIEGDQTGLTSTTGFSSGMSICLDGDDNIYVGQFRSLLKFPTGSSGNVASTEITLSPTLPSDLLSMTFDPLRQWIWISLNDSSGTNLRAYGLDGTERRSLSISGYVPYQTAIAEDGSIIVACQKSSTLGTIMVFAPNASGSATPTRQIGPGATSNIFQPAGVGIDNTTGIIYATDVGGSETHRIVSFATTANGNVAPLTTITGNLTELALLPSGDNTQPIRLKMHP
jgi:hypothetical protein